jgi:hypothetical protein
VGGDSYWYLRLAAQWSGLPVDQARRQASAIFCGDLQQAFEAGSKVRRCASPVLADGDARYRAIFESRPGYPILVAPFVKIMGLGPGAVAATALLFVLLAIVVHIALRVTAATRAGAVASSVALCVLPFAWWNSRLMADGSAVLLMVMALLGGVLILRRSTWPGVFVLTSALGFLFVVKPANGVALGTTFLACAVCFAVLAWRHKNPNLCEWLTVGGIAIVVTSAWLIVGSVLRLPSFEVTLQDLATTHFKRPDVADTWGYLLYSEWRLALNVVRSARLFDLLIPLAACGFVLRRLRAQQAALWIATSAAGLIVVAAHPLLGEYPRLVSPVWIVFVVAVGLLVDMLVARLRARGGLRAQVAARWRWHPAARDLE